MLTFLRICLNSVIQSEKMDIWINKGCLVKGNLSRKQMITAITEEGHKGDALLESWYRLELDFDWDR